MNFESKNESEDLKILTKSKTLRNPKNVKERSRTPRNDIQTHYKVWTTYLSVNYNQ